MPKLSDAPNLVKPTDARNVYAFRMAVPAAVRPYFGREIYKSLRDLTQGEATDAAKALTKQHRKAFNEVRALLKSRNAAALVKARADRIKLDLASAVAVIMDSNTTEAQRAGEIRNLGTVVNALLPVMESTVRAAIGAAAYVPVPVNFDGTPIDPKPGSVDSLSAGPFLHQAYANERERAALASIPRRSAADLAKLPMAQAVPLARREDDLRLADAFAEIAHAHNAPILAALGLDTVTSTGAENTEPLKLSDLVKVWLHETEAKRSRNATRQHRLIVGMLINSQGDRSILDSSILGAVVSFVREAAQAGKARGTIKRYLTTFNELGAWWTRRNEGAGRNVINPFAKLSEHVRSDVLPKAKPGEKGKMRAEAFRPSQTAAVLGLMEKAWGKHSDRFACLSLIAATGARPGEIMGLRASDIYQIGGQWVVDINENPDAVTRPGWNDHRGRTTKTGDVSSRIIPLHPAVRDLVLACKERNAKAFRLFEKDMPGQTHEKRVEGFGSAFTDKLRYRAKGMEQAPIEAIVALAAGKGSRQEAAQFKLYSFRHGLRDLIKSAWGADDISGYALQGWSEGDGSVAGYGNALRDLKRDPSPYRAKYEALAVLGAP